MKHRVTLIPGDGIGPEVIAAGEEVLAALALRAGVEMTFTRFDWSTERYKRTGAFIPDGGLEELKTCDAIYFGAVGAPDVPDHVTPWGLRAPIARATT